MSYLELPGLPEFTQAVISFWFKIPSESFTAISESSSSGEALFSKIIPLVVFGHKGKGHIPTHTEKETVTYFTSSGGFWAGGTNDIEVHCTSSTPTCCLTAQGTFKIKENPVFFPTSSEMSTEVKHTTAAGDPNDTEPSFIGVRCYGDTGELVFNFESNEKPSVTNYAHELRSITPGSATSTPEPIMTGTVVSTWQVLCCVCLIIEAIDGTENIVSDTVKPNGPPQTSTVTEAKRHWADITNLVMTNTGSIGGGKDVTVTPDEWHHVLMSVDLKDKISSHSSSNLGGNPWKNISGSSKVFLAFDDKNYDGDHFDNADPANPNHVVTQEAYRVAQPAPPPTGEDEPTGEATYSIELKIPEGPLGIPATSDFKEKIQKVDMAEFQMWLGQTLDTSDASTRRAFIEQKHPERGKTPTNPKKAKELMGTKPDVLLHRSGNWRHGKNTGTSHQLHPIGEIKKYKPDPELGK